MLNVGFYETRFAPPMRAITIETSILSIIFSAGAAMRIKRRHLQVHKVVQITFLVVQELFQIVILTL
jgi:hypothetical protein